MTSVGPTHPHRRVGPSMLSPRVTALGRPPGRSASSPEGQRLPTDVPPTLVSVTEMPLDPFPDDVPEELRDLDLEWQDAAQEFQRAWRELEALVGMDKLSDAWRGVFAMDELRVRFALIHAIAQIERVRRTPGELHASRVVALDDYARPRARPPTSTASGSSWSIPCRSARGHGYPPKIVEWSGPG
jgi:hypothetical protein